MSPPTVQPPYFDNQALPSSPSESYVAWFDIMGIRSSMLRSLPITSNFIFKLHVATLEEKPADVRLYPVMDGVYIAASEKEELRSFLRSVFVRLAVLFTSTTENRHRFLAKCAVAYGPIIHGADIDAHASPIFAENTANTTYKDSILLGMPMVFALQTESLAPPFGVAIHDSARDFFEPSERKWSHVWWPWFPFSTCQEAKSLRSALKEYFDWCEKRAGAIDYEPTRIMAHRAQAEQYFVDA